MGKGKKMLGEGGGTKKEEADSGTCPVIRTPIAREGRELREWKIAPFYKRGAEGKGRKWRPLARRMFSFSRLKEEIALARKAK